MADSPWIVDATQESFENDVLSGARDTLVLVDFWATWCHPCLMFAPTLEKVVNDYQGKVRLVKVNVDEQPQIAAACGAQSIPYILAFRGGQALDRIVGMLSEDQLREWIQSLLPSEIEQWLEQAAQIEAADAAAAEQLYRRVLEQQPANDPARIGLARVLLAQGRDDECQTVIAALEERGYLEPEAERVKSELELRLAADEAGSITEARKAVEADPDNLALRLKLADVLAVERQHREALEICLDLIQRDKAGIGPEAKSTMVRIFDTLPANSELVSEYRRKLATAWY